MKLAELASRLNCSTIGNPEIEITGLAPIEAAKVGELTFFNNRKYKRHLVTTEASAIIIASADDMPAGKSGIISSNPYLTFAEAMWLFHPIRYQPRGIHPSAVVSESAIIGNRVTIGPFCVIGDGVKLGDDITIFDHCSIYPEAEIGDQVLIHSHCIVREGCRIGARAIMQNNVTIGSDGFGFAKRPDNGWFKIPQAGIVIIEEDVEIGAGSTIDRATIGATVIGKGTKLDNLVQIGHGSSVGENTLLCAQVGLAGSTQVGNEVILSGQVGAAGHLKIGDRVIATAQTGIPNSVEAGKIVSGYPAIDNRDWLKSSVIFAQLPQIQKEIRALKEEVRNLKALFEKEKN
ncbi:MAG: UDP-3-O-(3-hydroxymyristoyl)glucosamine N-acyltransferase [Acidobacteriota bacterium]|nr:UDP-3-O-(3-hydroxymyristoyl)glucosamine N-acyltransferase [Acidobacteriota bacterium]